MKSSKIPEGWEYWTTETELSVSGEEAAWQMAVLLKTRREALRPDLFIRVRVIKAGGAHWILRREEPRVKENAA